MTKAELVAKLAEETKVTKKGRLSNAGQLGKNAPVGPQGRRQKYELTDWVPLRLQTERPAMV